MNENYYLSLDEPQQSISLALREIILKSNPLISETTKYKMPCFLYKKKIISYLWIDKLSKEPYVLFADGNKIDHPRLIQGDRKRMKVFLFQLDKDIPKNDLLDVIQKAISLVH